jgi:hypothetical protein
MQLVTLVNRSSKTLKGVWDGRPYDIAPGKHSFPDIQASKFQEQNPIMGTEDPYTLQKQYLIGIIEHGDDCSPVEQSDHLTLQDISGKLKSGELRIVPGNGLYRPATDKTNPFATGGPIDTSFVKA